jgi:hypothetical protein
VSPVLDDLLLDDPDRLVEADERSGGCLRAAASAGAQVRATLEAAAEAGLAELAGSRPRALVLLTRPGVGPAVAQLLRALLGPGAAMPIVPVSEIPSWVGPLDVVLAHSDDPGDLVLAASIDRARRYGAHVVITAEQDGPVAAAAAGTMLLAPRISLPVGFDYHRALAAGLALLDTLGLLRTDLEALADELDREAERDGVRAESFVNPAKSLVLRMAERTPVLCGLDPVAAAVGEYVVDTLARFGGIVAGVSDYPQLQSRTVLHRSAIRGGAAEDIFADPEDSPTPAVRVLLLDVIGGAEYEPVRLAATQMLPTADLLAPAEEVDGGSAGGFDGVSGGSAAVRAAVLALRFELASVYLGMATGALGGPGREVPVAVWQRE